jgi:hypothetical protein
METRIAKNKQKNRKTKRKYGGFLQNIMNITTEKNIKDNYYETKIILDNKEYKLNYFTPINFVIFKTTDQYKIPTFNIFTKKTQKEPVEYKIIIDDVYVNTIIKVEKNWYAITRSWDNYEKGKPFFGLYYRIYNVFTNNEEKLYLKKLKKYNIENDTIYILKYTLLEANKKSYRILEQFNTQQDTGEIVKEVVATDVAIEAADELF